MKGLGDVGELYEDLDGDLYEWVEGVDAWGDPIGFWQGVSEPEVLVLSGLGALYAAPDGTIYQVQGLADEAKRRRRRNRVKVKPRRRWGQCSACTPEQGLGECVPVCPRSGPALASRGGPPRKKGGFLKKLLPIAKFATRFIPGVGPIVSAGVDVASKLVKA